MRRTIVSLGLAAATVFAAGQRVVVSGTEPIGQSSPYDTAYSLASQVSVSGTIVGIGQSKPNADMPTNTRLVVQAHDKKHSTYLVELGPQWFVSKQPTHLKLGQWVRVTGSKIVDRGQPKILAMQVQLHNHDVLTLRRMDGDPYWADMNTATETVAQNSTPAVGTVLAQKTFMINGVDYPGYVVQTSTGPQNIVMMQNESQANYPPVQSYPLNNYMQILGAGYYPVVTVGGPAGANPVVVSPGYRGFGPFAPSGVMVIGPQW